MAISKAEAERIESACAAVDHDRAKVDELEGRLIAVRNEAEQARHVFDQIAAAREFGEVRVDARDEAAARVNRDRAIERVQAVESALLVARERAAASAAALERERLAARWGESSRIADRLRRERAEILAAAKSLNAVVEKYRGGLADLVRISPRSQERRDLVDAVEGRAAARISAIIANAVRVLWSGSATSAAYDHATVIQSWMDEEATIVRLWGWGRPEEAPPPDPAPEPEPPPAAAQPQPRRHIPSKPTPRPRFARGMGG